VLAAVHYAEIVAHRGGDPLGRVLLAVGVTVIEVRLIVSLMLSGGPVTAALAAGNLAAPASRLNLHSKRQAPISALTSSYIMRPGSLHASTGSITRMMPTPFLMAMTSRSWSPLRGEV
jgi:hypothetical protein